MIEQYIRIYGDRLYGLCLHLCRNRTDADDLYQETWLRALKNYEKYDRSLSFEPWLTKICVNLYRSWLMRLKRSPIHDYFASSEEKDALLGSVPDREREDYSDLRLAVGRLPEKLRMTVILYYFEGMDVKETAEILKVPEGTVKSRLSEARKRLKGALTDERKSL